MPEEGLFPATEQIYIKNGNIAHFTSTIEEAIWNYRKAIRINPNSFACYLLGNIFYMKGQFQEAIELYQNFYKTASLNYREEYNLAFEKICEMRELLRIEEQFK